MGSEAVVVAVVLTGCSFVYNPNNIGAVVDADVIADVDPTMLTLTDVYPTHVDEGTGTGNSRDSLLVVYGHQIAADATVTLTPASSDPSTITITSTTIASDHNFIALTVRVDDDLIDNDGITMPLTIAVAQSGGTYHAELASSVKLMHLNQLTTSPTETPPKLLYSTIAISDPISFATGKSHVIMRAVGSITIDGAITADAVLAAPGPGGCAGGDIGVDGASTNVDGSNCPGRGFAVAGQLLNGGGGGGAGFVINGEPGTSSGGMGGNISGTVQLADATRNVPSGGGGGAANNLQVGGGAAGGGGGSIEITAGGDLSIVAGVSANGGKGTDVTNGGGGGGGAGGAILVRAGGTATIGPLDVKRGEPGVKTGTIGNGVAGGAGSVGRTRIDAPNILTGAGYFGPTFIAPPSTSSDQIITLMIHGAIGDTTMIGQAFDRDGNAVDHGNFTPTFNGTGIAMPSLSLEAGYNRVCVTVQGGNAFTLLESANCTEIAFLP